jgi:hypothetical protein
MKTLLILTILSLLCLSTLGLQCKPTVLDFIGIKVLSLQDELIDTFSRLQEIISILPNVSYLVNETVSYAIFNAKPTFTYF